MEQLVQLEVRRSSRVGSKPRPASILARVACLVLAPMLTRRAKGNVKMLRRTARRHERIDATIAQFTKAQVTEESLGRKNTEKECDECKAWPGGGELEFNSHVQGVAMLSSTSICKISDDVLCGKERLTDALMLMLSLML